MGWTARLIDRILSPGPAGLAAGGKADDAQARNRKLLGRAAILLILVFPVIPFVDDYWIDVAFFAGIYSLLGLSLNIVLGEVGLFDLGHTAFYAVGAYVTAILNTRFHVPILLLLPISALAAGAFAWLVTAPVIHLKGDYLCIVTIGLGEIVRLTMINNPFGLTGGPNGINGVDTPSLIVPIASSRGFYYLVWALIGLSAFGLKRLQRSRLGRAWNFIREDEVAAEALGVDVRRYKLTAFVLGAALAGAAGNLYASKQMSVSPESFTFMESSLLFCIVLLGGLGSIPGTILGAIAVTVFPEVFRPFAKYRLMFFGLALLFMMIFKPAGFLPRRRDSSRTLKAALGGRRRKAKAVPVPIPEPVPMAGGSGVRSGGSAASHAANPAASEPILSVSGLRLAFGGVTAVADLDAFVPGGRITALIGPNGAGKTTLFNLITGIYKPSAGKVIFRGRDITGWTPHRIAGFGIARTFQNIRLFSNLTCLENVLCGQHSRAKSGLLAAVLGTGRQRIEERCMLEASEACLDRVGLGDLADSLASSLPYGKRRYLEIARALASRPDLIVLDEPSSGLNDAETEELAVILESLVADGLSILLIEHDMNLVDRVSDSVVVMQSGRKIAEGRMSDLRLDPAVIEAYLGAEEGGG